MLVFFPITQRRLMNRLINLHIKIDDKMTICYRCFVAQVSVVFQQNRRCCVGCFYSIAVSVLSSKHVESVSCSARAFCTWNKKSVSRVQFNERPPIQLSPSGSKWTYLAYFQNILSCRLALYRREYCSTLQLSKEHLWSGRHENTATSFMWRLQHNLYPTTIC